MPHAVEFYFDTESEANIREIWQCLQEPQGKNHLFVGFRPHISLAVYDSKELDIKAIKKDILNFTKDLKPFELKLSYTGFFPERAAVFLAPKVTKSLLKIHAKFHKKLKNHDKYLRDYYSTKNWIPHCTVYYGLEEEDFSKILAKAQNIDLPIIVKLEDIGIVEVDPEEAREIFTTKL